MLKHPFSIYDFSIRSYDSDQEGKLTLPALFHLLQECAWNNARLNDFGFEFLNEKNCIWVLSRVIVEIDEYPEWREEIKIKTWPKGADGLFAIRDFEIYKEDKVIGRVTSLWLVIDKDSKRPQKLDNFNFIHEDYLQENALNKVPGKIVFNGELQKLESRKVYYSDLDVNKHVNNATYVRWIFDSFFSDGNNKMVSGLEINFISELTLNDEFTVYKGDLGNGSFFVLKNSRDREVCKAIIV